MAEQTDIFVSHEREGLLGPPVTNAEIARRTRDANAHFLKLDDYLENNITAIGTITQELFFVPLLVPDEETDGRYIPERGNLSSFGGVAYPAVTEYLFALPDLEEKAQLVANLLKAKGIKFVYSLKREAPDKYSDADKISFYFAFGQNATNEVLDELTNSAPTGIYSPELHQNQLSQKKVVYMKLYELSRYLRRDANKEEVLYSPGHISVNIPYTPDMEISNSIASLAEVFDTMQKAGLLPLPQNPTLEIRFAKEIKSSVESAVEIAYTEEAYNAAVQRLKTQDREQQSNNPFVRQLSKDLDRVPFVTFREAVRMTNLNFPAIKGRDMVTRMEICEVGKTKSGDFVPLLPAGDYIPPEEDYRNHFMHSRIWETWQIGRSNLTEQLQEPKDFIKRILHLKAMDTVDILLNLHQVQN